MKNDQFEGFGLYVKADGSGYQGHFKNNMKEGEGTSFSSEGRLIHQVLLFFFSSFLLFICSINFIFFYFKLNYYN